MFEYIYIHRNIDNKNLRTRFILVLIESAFKGA